MASGSRSSLNASRTRGSRRLIPAAFDCTTRIAPNRSNDEAGQPVGFGMDEAIIRRIEQLLAQPQSAFEPAGKKAPADRPGGVAIEQTRSEQGMRVEHCGAEHARVGAPQGDQRAGCERLGLGIHLDLVREDPEVAAFGAPMTPGQQRDGGTACRIIRGELTGRCCIGAHPAYVVLPGATGQRPAPMICLALLHPAGVVVAARTAGLLLGTRP